MRLRNVVTPAPILCDLFHIRKSASGLGGYTEWDSDTNKQEWSIRLMVDPPAVSAPSERLG